MTRWACAAAAAALFVCAHSVLAQSQIQHDPIGCIVAGKFPKIDACFPGAEVARARVYFQKLGGAHWYWVDFKPSEVPSAGEGCYSAFLPRPTKAIAKMAYYVELADKSFQESRTDDRTVDVVPDAGGCKKDVPVAGWVQNAAVTVGAPAGAAPLPAGFVSASVIGGGIGTGVVVGGVAAASAAVGGAVALSSNSGAQPTSAPTAAPTSPPTATPAPVTPAPTAPATATPPPPTPTPAQPFQASLTVGPTQGTEPMIVTFDACASGGRNLRMAFDYDGDGIEDERRTFPSCSVSRTYTTTGVSLGPVRGLSASSRTYQATVRMWEAVTGGEEFLQTFSIRVDPQAPTCSGGASAVTITSPSPMAFVDAAMVPLAATATDPDGMSGVQFKAQPVGTPAPVNASHVAGAGPSYSATWDSTSPSCIAGDWEIWAQAIDSCGNTTDSGKVTAHFVCGGLFAPAGSTSSGSTSELRVAGGAAVLNVSGVLQPVVSGTSVGPALSKEGPVRVELTLLRGAAGTWRFARGGGWDPASLRVSVGQVLSLDRRSIVFRLKGEPGERVVFTFE
jgi:hypothetical protein